MNEVSLLINKINQKVVFTEKPYFYTDGKIIRSEPFPNPKCEKKHLEQVSGNDLKSIIASLNKEHKGKDIAVIQVRKDNQVTTQIDNMVTIECLFI